MKNIREIFADKNCHIDKMFWMPAIGVHDFDSLSNEFEHFLEYVERPDFFEVPPFFGKAFAYQESEEDFNDELFKEVIQEEIFRINPQGFLVYLMTPTNGSWGSCYCTWVYAETLDDVVKKMKKWVDSHSKK